MLSEAVSEPTGGSELVITEPKRDPAIKPGTVQEPVTVGVAVGVSGLRTSQRIVRIFFTRD